MTMESLDTGERLARMEARMDRMEARMDDLHKGQRQILLAAVGASVVMLATVIGAATAIITVID